MRSTRRITSRSTRSSRAARLSAAALIIVASARPLIGATPIHRTADRAADPRATAVLDTAIARMGGADVLRGLQRVRFEVMTQWQTIVFDDRPSADAPSMEWNTDQRDYTIDAWRNTRRFFAGAAGWREIADVVRDTVAIRRSPGGPGGVASPGVSAAGAWAPLNIAYVLERRERFAVAPERALVAARSAPDLRALPDTSVAGTPYARVAATIDGFPTTLLVRRTDGLLAAVRFRANEENDFGLVPFGEMEVEYWYAGWRKHPSGIVYPFQWDVKRVGRPYKRMTVMTAAFNPPAAPDSFAVSDSLRAAYVATARRAMHDLPLDSARLVDGRFASFATPGTPAGAVKLGRQWVLMEAGQAPLSVERAAAWLARSDASSDADARVAAAVLTTPLPGNGGAAWLAGRRVPMHAGPGVMPYVSAVMRGHGASASAGAVSRVTRGRWLAVDGDSLWMEPIDLPDAPGALVVWVPSLSWVYSGAAAQPLHLDYVMAHARKRGWKVDRVGSARGIAVAVPRP